MSYQPLDRSDILDIHANQIEFYGGDASIRDLGLLDSAIAQPFATFAGALLHADIFEMAAAHLFHIVSNHPFVDGNKRTGAVAAVAFLEINGIEIVAPPGELYDLTMQTAQSRADKAIISAFFRSLAPSPPEGSAAPPGHNPS